MPELPRPAISLTEEQRQALGFLIGQAATPILGCILQGLVSNLGPIIKDTLACIAANNPPGQSGYQPGDRVRCG